MGEKSEEGEVEEERRGRGGEAGVERQGEVGGEEMRWGRRGRGESKRRWGRRGEEGEVGEER